MRKPKDSIFGWLRGTASITGDIISPAIPPEAWETLKEWDALNAPRRPRTSKRSSKTRKSPRRRG